MRYEALIDEPDDVVSGVCAFLDLAYDPAMLRFFEQSDRVPAKVRSNPRHARLAEPLSKGARSWRTDMPASQLEVFEATAGDLLTELGYPRAVPRPSRRRPGPGGPGCVPVAGPTGAGAPSGSAATLAGDSLTSSAPS